MADPWVRPKRASALLPTDHLLLAHVVQGAKNVLEFGPGDSTQVFLDAGVERIVSCEYIDKWFDVAVERFKDEPRVTILKFTDTFPVVVEGIGDEMFDVAFVDAPKGLPLKNRYVHLGYEDCSRMNTCLYALERAKAVYLHDAYRPNERATLGRLIVRGFKCEFLKPSPIGFAKIYGNQNATDTPDAEEPGSPPTGTEPKQRRLSIYKRFSGLDRY